MINSENENFFSESFPFWKALSSDEKKLINNNTELKLYKAGSTIHDSTECTGVLLIKSGELRVYILSPEGRKSLCTDWEVGRHVFLQHHVF